MKVMSDQDRQAKTEQIKADYLTDRVTFVAARYSLRRIGHTPDQATKLVYEWIKEKHNGPRDK